MKDHSIKLSILKALSQGGFYSGEALGKEFGISRAAISKHIQGIQTWGVDIFSVQGKGYQLAQPLQMLDQQQLQSSLKNHVELIPVIDSTNQYLLDNVDNLASGSVCIAEYQSQGRGRRGREWVSPFGSNLYFSMFWRLDAGMAAAMGLSLVVGVAIVEALEQLGLIGIKLKWPNDLYYQDKKLAGILIEMSGQAGAAANLVIGLGLNLCMEETTKNITQPWTSLSEIAASENLDRNHIAIAVVNALNHALNHYERHGMTGFVERWNRLDNFIERPVKLIMGAREIKGIAKGINPQGAILLQTTKGLEAFIGGEMSLRSDQSLTS